jgi:CheY-like chemotaxis protein
VGKKYGGTGIAAIEGAATCKPLKPPRESRCAVEGMLQDEPPLPSIQPTIPGVTFDSSLLLSDVQHTNWYRGHPGRQRRWALILEPHRKLAELLGFLLDFELGIQSVAVPRPRLIPTLFRGWTPDLVIAEIPATVGIPSADDLELLRPVLAAVQAAPGYVPVLLCTAYTEITPALAHSAGFAGLMHKPFTPATLVSTVRGIVETMPVTN